MRNLTTKIKDLSIFSLGCLLAGLFLFIIIPLSYHSNFTILFILIFFFIGLIVVCISLSSLIKYIPTLNLLGVTFAISGFSLGLLGIFYEVNSEEISSLSNKSDSYFAWMEPNGKSSISISSIQNSSDPYSAYYLAIDLSKSVNSKDSIGKDSIPWISEAIRQLTSQNIAGDSFELMLKKSKKFSSWELQFIEAAYFLTFLKDKKSKFHISYFGETAGRIDFDGMDCTAVDIQKASDMLFRKMNEKNPSVGNGQTDFIELFRTLNSVLKDKEEKKVNLIILSDLQHENKDGFDPLEMDSSEYIKNQGVLLSEQIGDLNLKPILPNIIFLTSKSQFKAITSKKRNKGLAFSILPFLDDEFSFYQLRDVKKMTQDDIHNMIYFKKPEEREPVNFFYESSRSQIFETHINFDGEFDSVLVQLESNNSLGHFPRHSLWIEKADTNMTKLCYLVSDRLKLIGDKNSKEKLLTLKYDGYPLDETNLPKLKIVTKQKNAESTYNFRINFFKKLSKESSYLMFVCLCIGLVFLVIFVYLWFCKGKVIKNDLLIDKRLLSEEEIKNIGSIVLGEIKDEIVKSAKDPLNSVIEKIEKIEKRDHPTKTNGE